jgi:hypothetical protein
VVAAAGVGDLPVSAEAVPGRAVVADVSDRSV